MLNKTTMLNNEFDDCIKLELLAPCFVMRATRKKAAQKIFFDSDIFEYLNRLCGWGKKPALACYKLYVDSNGYAYIKARKCRARIYLHHLIVGRPAKGMRVDHWNTNTLDNRRVNLRHVTVAQNGWNRVPNKGHRFIGITQLANGRWRARAMRNGVHHSLGLHATAEDAATAYDAFTREHDGVYGRGNRPQAALLQLSQRDGAEAATGAAGYPTPAARILRLTPKEAAESKRLRLKLAA